MAYEGLQFLDTLALMSFGVQLNSMQLLQDQASNDDVCELLQQVSSKLDRIIQLLDK